MTAMTLTVYWIIFVVGHVLNQKQEQILSYIDAPVSVCFQSVL